MYGSIWGIYRDIPGRRVCKSPKSAEQWIERSVVKILSRGEAGITEGCVKQANAALAKGYASSVPEYRERSFSSEGVQV